VIATARAALPLLRESNASDAHGSRSPTGFCPQTIPTAGEIFLCFYPKCISPLCTEESTVASSSPPTLSSRIVCIKCIYVLCNVMYIATFSCLYACVSMNGEVNLPDDDSTKTCSELGHTREDEEGSPV
jgi:hypothetical protein